MVTVTDRLRALAINIMPHLLERFGGTFTVLIGGVTLLWLTVSVTFSSVMQVGDPQDALRFWPLSAGARSRAAENALVAEPRPATVATVRGEAQRALLREPGNVVAARMAGLAALLANEPKAGRRLLNYAQTLSRRDLPTQVALIELAVADKDIPVALSHYDIALRTGEGADHLLMPVLAKAARSPEIAQSLRGVLIKRPPWRMRFVYSLIAAPPWPSTFFSLITAARLDVSDPLERDFLNRSTKGLVANGDIAAAARIYQLATNRSVGPGIRNGSFRAEDRVAPFDWEIVDDPGLGATKGAVNGASYPSVLSLNADAGRSGVVASELLLLKPGRYHLGFTTGNVGDADQSNISISCDGASRELISMALPRSGDRARASHVTIDVPSNCDHQWLRIRAATDIDASAQGMTQPWISGIVVTR